MRLQDAMTLFVIPNFSLMGLFSTPLVITVIHFTIGCVLSVWKKE